MAFEYPIDFSNGAFRRGSRQLGPETLCCDGDCAIVPRDNCDRIGDLRGNPSAEARHSLPRLARGRSISRTEYHANQLIGSVRALLPIGGLEGLVATFVTVEGMTSKLLAQGAPGSVEIRARAVVEAAVRFQSTALLIAHNHPSEDPRPSRQDIDATRRLKHLLDALDIELLDHWIVVTGQFYSIKTGRSSWL